MPQLHDERRLPAEGGDDAAFRRVGQRGRWHERDRPGGRGTTPAPVFRPHDRHHQTPGTARGPGGVRGVPVRARRRGGAPRPAPGDLHGRLDRGRDDGDDPAPVQAHPGHREQLAQVERVTDQPVRPADHQLPGLRDHADVRRQGPDAIDRERHTDDRARTSDNGCARPPCSPGRATPSATGPNAPQKAATPDQGAAVGGLVRPPAQIGPHDVGRESEGESPGHQLRDAVPPGHRGVQHVDERQDVGHRDQTEHRADGQPRDVDRQPAGLAYSLRRRRQLVPTVLRPNDDGGTHTFR